MTIQKICSISRQIILRKLIILIQDFALIRKPFGVGMSDDSADVAGGTESGLGLRLGPPGGLYVVDAGNRFGLTFVRR